jgi:uncharacterized protein (UPF0332 family)
MSITASDIVTHAKALQANGSEAEQRNVMSRAYYAAYHDCNAWHRALPTPGSVGTAAAGGVHSQLIAVLSNPMVKGRDATRSKMRGYRLKALKMIRTKADYQLEESIETSEAPQSIEDAEAILGI